MLKGRAPEPEPRIEKVAVACALPGRWVCARLHRKLFQNYPSCSHFLKRSLEVDGDQPLSLAKKPKKYQC
jgi:hypothetical protein